MENIQYYSIFNIRTPVTGDPLHAVIPTAQPHAGMSKACPGDEPASAGSETVRTRQRTDEDAAQHNNGRPESRGP